MTKRNPEQPLSTNPHLLKWVKKMAALCRPRMKAPGSVTTRFTLLTGIVGVVALITLAETP